MVTMAILRIGLLQMVNGDNGHSMKQLVANGDNGHSTKQLVANGEW